MHQHVMSQSPDDANMSRPGMVLSKENAIDKYKQGFQEEAREILLELESVLLALDQNRADLELIGQSFRALHTIKGSGAMFGFTALAAFTHNIENAYDEVRNGKIEVTDTLIELSLAALDQMKIMLSGTDQGAADTARCTEIVTELRRLTGVSPECPESVEPIPANLAQAPTLDGSSSQWHIRFSPGQDFMRTGSDPLVLLRELRKLGCTSVLAHTDSIPILSLLDPERCYIAWEILLTSSASYEEIRDVFIFVEDLCDLLIEPTAGQSQLQSQPMTDGASGGPVPSLSPEVQPVSFDRRAEDKMGISSSIRVPTRKLDQFVDLVGELVTVQARLAEIATRYDDSDVAMVSEEVERLTSALRENSMSIRMLPIRGTFERFRRLIHDLARELHKEVELIIEGADTELDKTVIDQLNDPLMHLIRNSMDHGIESQEARLIAGKPSYATILLKASHSGANVVIQVSDDGAGINAEAVRNRAIERGLIVADAQLTEAEIYSLILSAGFSTAIQISDVSGRGVGMDVVRQRVEALRGSIHIDSKRGRGTSVSMRLPLTLAIIDGLLVRVGEAYFVLPLANSLECIELTRQDIAVSNGKHVANVRGEIIPYIRLREYFYIENQPPAIEQIMIAETDSGRCGFVVDEVLGDHQTVIKNLGRFYRHVQFISGATILGNGSLALILDPNRVIEDTLKLESPTRNKPRRSSLRSQIKTLAALPTSLLDAPTDYQSLNSS